MVTTMPQRRTNRSMSGRELLKKAGKAMQYKRVVDNSRRMHGIFGETDEHTRTIRINKKLHKQKNGGHLIKNPDGTEKIIGTIIHEELHAAHPKAYEKTIRKAARRRVKVINRKTKERLYARYRRVR